MWSQDNSKMELQMSYQPKNRFNQSDAEKKAYRLLLIGSVYPQSVHTVRAANVVIFELLRALAERGDCEVGYLLVRRHSDPLLTETEIAGLSELSRIGIELLPPIRLSASQRTESKWLKRLKLIFDRRTFFYPDCVHADTVLDAVRNFNPNIFMVPWSEWLTALCADFPYKKFAYYGNPDHKSATFRFEFDRRHNLRQQKIINQEKIIFRFLEAAHLRVMNCYDLVGNVAANDADYYKEKGHKNSFYIQNVWIDRFPNSWEAKRDQGLDISKILKIIANVGQLGGTANRYGLEILGREVVPRLQERMRNIPYEIHILGKGELSSSLSKLLTSPEIIIRGFVDDIDEEMFNSALFLCLNNASPYKVGHTRYLHAWSLGMCVVAHVDASLSMPEMRHQENCLLGKNSFEVAELIYEAAVQRELREKIGAAGYSTFRRFFTAESVSKSIWDRIDKSHEKRLRLSAV